VGLAFEDYPAPLHQGDFEMAFKIPSVVEKRWLYHIVKRKDPGVQRLDRKWRGQNAESGTTRYQTRAQKLVIAREKEKSEAAKANLCDPSKRDRYTRDCIGAVPVPSRTRRYLRRRMAELTS
jgi:hypothetical protein